MSGFGRGGRDNRGGPGGGGFAGRGGRGGGRNMSFRNTNNGTWVSCASLSRVPEIVKIMFVLSAVF